MTLLPVLLGRAWRWSSAWRSEPYLKTVAMFEDQPLAPYSLHVMAALGATHGKSVGEWYGPNTVAHLIRLVTCVMLLVTGVMLLVTRVMLLVTGFMLLVTAACYAAGDVS